jgi:hypothetical protein
MLSRRVQLESPRLDRRSVIRQTPPESEDQKYAGTRGENRTTYRIVQASGSDPLTASRTR